MNEKPNLKDEFNFYLENQENFLKDFEGKFITIINKKVIGSFNTYREAFDETLKNHELGTFLIQKCTKGSSDYTTVFHSRVA